MQLKYYKRHTSGNMDKPHVLENEDWPTSVKRKMRDCGGLFVASGPPGSGKTYRLVKGLLPSFNQHRRIIVGFSNEYDLESLGVDVCVRKIEDLEQFPTAILPDSFTGTLFIDIRSMVHSNDQEYNAQCRKICRTFILHAMNAAINKYEAAPYAQRFALFVDPIEEVFRPDEGYGDNQAFFALASIAKDYGAFVMFIAMKEISFPGIGSGHDAKLLWLYQADYLYSAPYSYELSMTNHRIPTLELFAKKGSRTTGLIEARTKEKDNPPVHIVVALFLFSLVGMSMLFAFHWIVILGLISVAVSYGVYQLVDVHHQLESYAFKTKDWWLPIEHSRPQKIMFDPMGENYPSDNIEQWRKAHGQ